MNVVCVNSCDVVILFYYFYLNHRQAIVIKRMTG